MRFVVWSEGRLHPGDAMTRSVFTAKLRDRLRRVLDSENPALLNLYDNCEEGLFDLNAYGHAVRHRTVLANWQASILIR